MSSDSSAESENSEDEGQYFSDEQHISKLVQHLRIANQKTTLLLLCVLRDASLFRAKPAKFVKEAGGIELLLNILDAKEHRCKMGALLLLVDLTRSRIVRREIVRLGQVGSLVDAVTDVDKRLADWASQTLTNMSRGRKSRDAILKFGGIQTLVNLLISSPHCDELSEDTEAGVRARRSCAVALCELSRCPRCILAMYEGGITKHLAEAITSQDQLLVIPVVGILQECATLDCFRRAFKTEGIVERLVQIMRQMRNTELQTLCANSLFRAAEDREIRGLVRRVGGLDLLLTIISDETNRGNSHLLQACTGVIWQCAPMEDNARYLQQLKSTDILVTLLKTQPEQVLINVVGALSECCKIPESRAQVGVNGGLELLVKLVTTTNQKLLVNVTKAVGACVLHPDNMAIAREMDVLRLLWSLLKSEEPQVLENAAWAIRSILIVSPESTYSVRNFVGGLELLIAMLSQQDNKVLAAGCSVIAAVVKDEENLAVITDNGAVSTLSRLAVTTDSVLRRHLAEAVANCCALKVNRVNFGIENIVAPMVSYLSCDDEEIKRHTVRALHYLSSEPANCVAMHQNGSVKFLLGLVSSVNESVQEDAAGCLWNIRHTLCNRTRHRTPPT